MRKFRKKGQNVAEYAILIALVIAAAVGMQLYVKRGLQARTKGAVEFLQKNSTIGGNLQYEPYYTESYFNVAQQASSTTDIGANMITSTSANTFSNRELGGYQRYSNVEQE